MPVYKIFKKNAGNSEACVSVAYTDMYANGASDIVKLKELAPRKNYWSQLDGEASITTTELRCLPDLSGRRIKNYSGFSA